jgi:hypothetical protein
LIVTTRQFIPIRLLLSINLIFSTAVILLSGAAALRIPVRSVSLLVSVILLTLATWLIFHCRKRWPDKNCWLFFLVGILTISYAIWPAIRKKAFVSLSDDTWAYAAFGQYLKDYSRGTRGGLPAIDQFSVFLSGTRFGTPTLLAFISDLTGRTTAEVLTAFTWIVLFNAFAGIASFCHSTRLSAIPVIGASIFFILCGWLPAAVVVGNLDNILLLSILPATMVRYHLFPRGKKSIETVVALAITTTACFYSYPEGVAIAGIILLPWLAGQFVRDFGNRRNWKFYVLFLVVFLVLVEPYALTFVKFLTNQIASVEQAAHHPFPGEGYFFPGLVTPRFVTGVFGLGGEALYGHYPARIPNISGFLIAAVLLFLLLSGANRWRKRNQTLAISLLALICLAFWQGVLNRYDYGLYKILLVGSVLWIPCIFAGIEGVSNLFAHSTKYKVQIGLSGFICIACLSVKKANLRADHLQTLNIGIYSSLMHLQKVIDDKPVALICDQDIDQQWSAFFLRNANLTVRRYTPYMTAAVALMGHARMSGEPPEYVLTDYDAKGALWRNSRLRLLRADLPPQIVGIDAPNKLEGNHHNFFWLGNNPVRFYITSDKEQTGCLRALAEPGPSRPGDDFRTVTVRSDQETARFPVSASFSCDFRLHRGLNQVDVWCNEQRTISEIGPSDTRTLLVGLLDFSISACGDGTR